MFKLCAPSIIYLCFSLLQIIINLLKGLFEDATFKFITMIMVTILLNILCQQNLEVVAWIIVFVPFILMTELTIMLVYIFGVNHGQINYKQFSNNTPI